MPKRTFYTFPTPDIILTLNNINGVRLRSLADNYWKHLIQFLWKFHLLLYSSYTVKTKRVWGM